ncbi:hypothetical protein IBX35_05235 [Candidatus Bathyarchaeota archaeon]|nr:hypothetical protein [Candidatus Bathyarchaeota archaeon]
MIFSIFSLASETLFSAVNAATYVEGPIIQDTVWTLVDSPFIVSEDVIIYPDVTLTIEPEVEVEFGGDFSLIVEGRLVANGTTDSEGCCILVFNAPRTTAQLSIIVTANVTKNGYISGENKTTITVTPEAGGGWPLMTILLIVIPIVIVVIVLVLVKLKVIGFSGGEEP